ncbi:hypothetical protein Rhopal_002347-T1 [Rhodotorula paludigena]|uniref:PIN domain-like protein n=1 Tax=Rhodotorula paludigena TaxID=86838 RepID=A0AAV5GJ46_9BASI|nr:hypothetical protein Rhopal_002347-T1 [Rhodotorula paludigena]
MGVRDLTAIAKKFAPTCVTPQPSLRAFAGKRLAIDANLLTTKFHYAGTGTRSTSATSSEEGAEAHRHARAWYYFLEALRKEDIRPVVVFDGSTRVKAKERENERRRKARELQRLRAAAEGDRGERLREIRKVWSDVDIEERGTVAETFRSIVAQVFERSHTEPAAQSNVDKLDLPASAEGDESSLPSPPPPVNAPRTPAARDASISQADQKETATPLHQAAPTEVESPSPVPDASVLEPVRRPELPAEETTLSNASKLLATPAFGTLSAPVVALFSLYTAYRDDSSNPIYSKNQALVTTDEGAFFRSILQPESPAALISLEDVDIVSDDAKVELDEIIERSDKLSASHTKRSEAVPYTAFREVRRLVQAMGVPFLEPAPSEPHEAEGVCSALHALGLVDYVVSEDTDVAVYGAPLLRRITVTPSGTGREAREPMNVLDPVRLRDELGLTKEEFVDFALLCGTDFTERIPNLGPVTALKLIKEHKSIEAVLSATSGRYSPLDGDVSAYLQTVRDARAIFLTLPNLPLPTSSTASSAASADLLHPPIPPVNPDDDDAPASAPSSSFLGSLDPSPPAPELPALLRSYGISRPTFSPVPVLYPPDSDEWEDDELEVLEDALRLDLGDDGDAPLPLEEEDEAADGSAGAAKQRQNEALSAEFERMFL